MYLKKTLNRQGRIFLSFVQGYRDENGKVKQKTIENIGFLDELEKTINNPIEHFKSDYMTRFGLIVCTIAMIVLGFISPIYEQIVSIAFGM
jgi:hypothetical protein